MASTVDYGRLRDQTLGSGQEEEAVTVNTRALIDKVLARYSGEWTTFRELIQNAADASASKIIIKFETLPSPSVPTPQSIEPSEHVKHKILYHTIKRVLVTNDGQPFTGNDWARLKRIAEGNPDETKIGAFGVGFYSVFADCENPFVASGNETMAFYWKGNSLFTRKGTLPADHQSRDTCFVLDYRSTTSPVPNLMSICQFLCTSLTFISLESIELWLDDLKLFNINKKLAPVEPVPIPKEIETRTKEGMFRINSVERQTAQIDTAWSNIVAWVPVGATRSSGDGDSKSAPSLRSFFSRLTGASQNNASARRVAKAEALAQQAISEDLLGTSKATVFIRVNTAQIKSHLSSTFASELERATKKQPPKTTRIAVLTSSYEEASASIASLEGNAAIKAEELVNSILPTKSGRIFIGFPTAQTTGLLAHISAPSLIPTVERENIDLNARYVLSWNSELLRVAGTACRIAYAGEMAYLRSRITASTTSGGPEGLEAAINTTMPAAVHVFKQYTFRESTPLAKAGQIIDEAFWTSNKHATIEIFSSRGVLPSHDVRMASENLSFVKGIPVVPEDILKDGKEFLDRLMDFGLLSDMTTADIKKELEKQALSSEQLIEFLKWAAQKVKIHELDQRELRDLFSVTIADLKSDTSSETSTLLDLSKVESYTNPVRISGELPLPPSTLPFQFSRKLEASELRDLGFEELNTVPWLKWIIQQAERNSIDQKYNILITPKFARDVLAAISKSWDPLSQSSKATVTEMLISRPIMPTKQGMKKPGDSYFPTVKLFDDLPTHVELPGVKEKFLRSLGVRKTIELPVIFERLLDSNQQTELPGKRIWSHVDVIKYLVSVENDIPREDMNQLRQTSLCPMDGDAISKIGSLQRFRVGELFRPDDALRALGLPIIQWLGVLSEASLEGKFLSKLGLRKFPSVPELFDVMLRAHRAGDSTKYEQALKYYISNHYQNNYEAFNISEADIEFFANRKCETWSAC